MKVVNVHSLPTELWYPYGRPRGTHADQSSEGSQFDLAHFAADRSDYRRLDQVTLGL